MHQSELLKNTAEHHALQDHTCSVDLIASRRLAVCSRNVAIYITRDYIVRQTKKLSFFIFSIFIKSFSIFKLKGISRFWAVCKTISPISTVVSPFHSKFSQASLHQSEPPSKTSIANQFLCYFHPCHVVVSSLFVVHLKRELLHHGRQVGDEEKTEIRVVSG